MSAIAIVIAAAALSAGLIVVLRPLLTRYALARPNARSSHREPTPQGAGIAVVAAAIVVTLAALFPAGPAPSVMMVVGAAVFIALVGAVDDIQTVPVAPRLVLQAIAVGVMIAALPAELRIVSWLPWGLERALLLIGGVWFLNVVNFMDGIDWMTVAEMVPVTATLAILGLHGLLPPDAVAVALAVCGAMLGFAPFNRPVAQVFLGDVGSLPIGLLLAWLLILLAAAGQLAAAVLLPLYYIADATITLSARMAKGERFWEAHRGHFYQRAITRGFSVPETVGWVFALNCVLAVLAAVTVWTTSVAITVLALLAAAILVGALLYGFARGKGPDWSG